MSSVTTDFYSGAKFTVIEKKELFCGVFTLVMSEFCNKPV